MTAPAVDLGSGYSAEYFGWWPDRDIQTPEWHAEHDGHADVDKAGLILTCPHGDGFGGSVLFDIPEAVHLGDVRWTVESWDPLTLSPSISMPLCGCHGYIREGRWVSA